MDRDDRTRHCISYHDGKRNGIEFLDRLEWEREEAISRYLVGFGRGLGIEIQDTFHYLMFNFIFQLQLQCFVS
jgi:hypothetical protein